MGRTTGGTGGTGPGVAGEGSNGQAGAMLPAGSSATDFDGDGITDASDACVEIPRETDGNGDGCPDRPAALADTDGDGTPDSAEDADGDGKPDSSDACPSTPAGSTDANGDGCPDSTTGGGGTGDGGGTGGTDPGAGGSVIGGGLGQLPDTLAPTLTSVAKAQRALRAKALVWTAKSSEACLLTVTAKLRPSGSAR